MDRLPLLRIIAVRDGSDNRFLLKFREEDGLIPLIKTLPGAVLSYALQGWTVPNNPGMLRRIFQDFKGKARIDTDGVFRKIAEKRVRADVPGEPGRNQEKGPERKRTGKSRNKPERTRGTGNPGYLLPPLDSGVMKRVDEFVRWMQQRRYSDNTIRTYSDGIRTFFRFHSGRSPDSLSNSDLEVFNYEFIIRNRFSASYQNQIINAVKLFYRKMEGRVMVPEEIERPKKEERLPNVLSKEEVKMILGAPRNLKHRAMLSLIYACGLRRGELINLVPSDVDSRRGLLIIRQAKGNKDRVVPLSAKIVDLLREYYVAYRPLKWLFEGQIRGERYSPTSLQEVLKKSLDRVGIQKPVTLHWLRHSYATHLLESGTDLRYIQELMGHKSSRTTEIYTHVSQKNIQQIRSPFDDL